MVIFLAQSVARIQLGEYEKPSPFFFYLICEFFIESDACILGGLSKFRAFRPDSVQRCPCS